MTRPREGVEEAVRRTPPFAVVAAHARHMAHAVRVSGRALGDTAENPSVGCVIVKDGVVVGTGHTCCGGRPHAETQALAMAGEAARGADVYVTLEPCAHHGRTPPCADALVAAGVRRVFIAVEDPDPRVSGRGIDILRAAGIEVTTGLLEDEATRVLAGYLMRKRHGRPRVTLKLAVSADGFIAETPGYPTAITGARARARAHLMRARTDAILVGVDTVIADDPMLTCRLPGLGARSPIRVIADSQLRTPTDAALLRTPGAAPTWIFTTLAGRDRAGGVLRAAPHVRILPVAHDGQGRVDLAAMLRKMGEEGVNNLLVEGGARLARAFLEAGLVDEFALFTARQVRLGKGVPALAGLSLEEALAHDFAPIGEESLGADVLRVYEARQ